MTDNVIISIKGKQLYSESVPDEMELVTSGTLKCDGRGGCTISYQETELTGLEGTVTKLHIKDGQVTLLREGSINSQMVFEEGRRHLSVLDVEPGDGALQAGELRLLVGYGAAPAAVALQGAGGHQLHLLGSALGV